MRGVGRMISLDLLRPAYAYGSLLEVPLPELSGLGIRGIIIDIDNTLTEWRSPLLSDVAAIWLAQAAQEGIRVCLVSNNSPRRAREVADKAGIPFVARAQKPRRHSFRRAMEIMETTAGQTAVIGDQLFTDILGGNRMGLLTILVTPISSREFFGTRLMRLVEAFFLKLLKLT
ncbi:MAG: YqeG family HAD IIIA-type phosphatase [Thermacetogeniaceae bacterium]